MPDPISMAAILGGAGQAAGAFGGLLSSIFGDDGEDERRQAAQLFGSIPRPEFDFSSVQAPGFEFVGDVNPRTYQPTLPGQAHLAAGSDQRAQQLLAMGQLDQAIGGLSQADRLQAEAINEDLATGAHRNQLALEQGLLGRGRLGAGDSVQLGLLNSQNDRQLRGALGRSLTQNTLNRSVEAAGLKGQLAGQVRGQDEALNQVNAGIRNRFEEVISSLLTGAAQDNTTAQNLAAFQNRDLRQDQANLGQQAQLSTDFANLENQNALRNQLANFDLARVGGQAGALGNLATHRAAQQSALNQTIGSIGQGIGQGVGGIFDLQREGQQRSSDEQLGRLLRTFQGRLFG